MPLNAQNLSHINAMTDIHVKFQRAIGAGSRKVFEELKNKMNIQGTALASNAIELEKPEARNLIISSVANIKNRKMDFGLTLSMSVQDTPESCVTTLRFYASAKATGDGPFGLNITCSLMPENGTRWDVSMDGSCLTMMGDVVAMLNEAKPDNVSETDALMFVKEIAREYEQFL